MHDRKRTQLEAHHRNTHHCEILFAMLAAFELSKSELSLDAKRLINVQHMWRGIRVPHSNLASVVPTYVSFQRFQHNRMTKSQNILATGDFRTIATKTPGNLKRRVALPRGANLLCYVSHTSECVNFEISHRKDRGKIFRD